MYVVQWEKLCDSKGRGLGWAPVRGISEGPVVGDRPFISPGVCSLGALDCGLRPGTVSCWLKLFVGFGERKDINNTCFVLVLYIFHLCFMPSWSGSNESWPYFCRLGSFKYPEEYATPVLALRARWWWLGSVRAPPYLVTGSHQGQSSSSSWK